MYRQQEFSEAVKHVIGKHSDDAWRLPVLPRTSTQKMKLKPKSQVISRLRLGRFFKYLRRTFEDTHQYRNHASLFRHGYVRRLHDADKDCAGAERNHPVTAHPATLAALLILTSREADASYGDA